MSPILTRLFAVVMFYLYAAPCSSQYYYTGEILDENNKLVANTQIFIHSTRVLVNAGSSGTFGIMTPARKVDTFTIQIDGYEKLVAPVYLDKYNVLRIKLLASVANLQKNRLSSCVKDLKIDNGKISIAGAETYNPLVENEFIQTEQYATTRFSAHSDRASYSNIRRFINSKSQVPTNAVRIDEMINYFNINTDYPTDEALFKVSSQYTQCPWNKNNYLLYLNVAAKKLALDKIPASNLVFLIDNSGSMELQNRLPLLKASFKMLVENLRAKDKITIITYGGGVQILLDAVPGNFKDSINKVIDAMEPSGDTPGESAITLAYLKAKHNFINGGNNRIILATDGDFNVGISDEEQLQRMISLQSQSGIYLTCLGVGMGNYKDSKLEVLAKKGNGNFAYIDTETEGQKILVTEFTQTLYSVADDVTMQVSFDKEYIKQYRLIGYDNKQNALNDNSSELEGGQIGSGYSSIILFEITPNHSIDSSNIENYIGKPMCTFTIDYTGTETKKKGSFSYQCKFDFKPLLSLPKFYGFITSVAMYGSYIKKSKYNKSTLDDIKDLLQLSVDNTHPLQTEFQNLVEKSFQLYEPGKKRKGRRSNR